MALHSDEWLHCFQGSFFLIFCITFKRCDMKMHIDTCWRTFSDNHKSMSYGIKEFEHGSTEGYVEVIAMIKVEDIAWRYDDIALLSVWETALLSVKNIARHDALGHTRIFWKFGRVTILICSLAHNHSAILKIYCITIYRSTNTTIWLLAND